MANVYSALGFEASDRKDFERLMRQAARSGIRVGRSGKIHYVLWTPGDGIELWVQMTPQETIIGCNPFFSGIGHMRMGVMQIAEDPDHPMNGFFEGWASPEPHQTDSGLYPFAVDVPDFQMVKEKVLISSAIDLRVCAFADSLRCYQDDQEFERHPLSDEEAHLGAEAFIPVGVLDQTNGRPRAEAVLTGHIHSAEIRANPNTGRKFHRLTVQTLGGVVDVVAAPSSVTGLPVEGGVVYGTFWLTARLMSTGR
jgi:hypothetical protein